MCTTLKCSGVIYMQLRIRDLREDREFSQEFVAHFLLCDQSLYSKYERNEREIPLRLILRLAEFYGVSIDYLVRLTDHPLPYPHTQSK